MGVQNQPCPYCEDGETTFDEIAKKCDNCGWHTCSDPVVIYGDPRCPECENPL